MAPPPSNPRQRPRPPPSAWSPTRPAKRGASPATLGDVLVGTQESLARRSGCAIPRDEWREIVGPRIAGRTRVGRLYSGVLTLKVASSAWSNELSLLKPTIVSKLQMAGHDVSDLRFKVEGLDAVNNGGSRPPTLSPPRATVAAALPTGLQERLNTVEDPVLRAAIAEAAGWSLGQKKGNGYNR